LPADLPRTQALAAKLSHVVLYALLIAMPLIGWGMLSAGGYPIVLYGSFHLPEYLPHHDELHSILRTTHTVLAYVFFATLATRRSSALPCLDPSRRCISSHGGNRASGASNAWAPNLAERISAMWWTGYPMEFL
jgi:hypothetical protein